MPARFLIKISVCVVFAATLVPVTLSSAQDKASETPTAKVPAASNDPTAAARNRMVQRHFIERGLKNPRVLEAFRTVPRHRFLPPKTQRAGLRR